jgi:Tfp pilus assembly protein PilX
MNMQILKSERGVATLIALLMMAMLLLIGLAALSTSDDEVTIAGNEMQEMKAFYAAEAGLEKATSILQAYYDSSGAPPSVMPSGDENLNDCVVAYSVTDGGAVEQRPLTVGSLSGLNAQVKSFTANSIGISPTDGSKVEMSVSFESALVPIFQFAVFYGNDLEIAPGPDMSVIGRVHSNGDLWIQAKNTLSMDSYVTAAGNIHHGRKGAGNVKDGDVLIKDATGNYVSMKDGGGWLESDDSHWYDTSVARWGGRIQDAAHGQQELHLPLTDTNDPHSVIDRADGNPDSFENLADLIIKDGTVVQKQADGSWLDVTAAMIADGTLSYSSNKFYDQRESEFVDVTDLDIEKMYDNGYAPSNGVLYFADDISGGSEWPALRVSNGAELDAGLTIASENPLYTVGDFNSTNKKPASLMADAITFLSDAWVDTKGAAPKGDRIANATTVNASYLTGNTETTAATYNGGFENLPRFLEVWSGTNFTWSGSAVNLWNSAQADGDWSGSYYSAPIRDWSYDTDLDDPANHPPEAPTVRIFQRTGWRQEFVGFE